MKFRAPELKLPLLMVFFERTGSICLGANCGPANHLFLADGDAGQSGKSSLEPVNPQSESFHDTAQAPVQLFNFSPPNNLSPTPVSPVFFLQQRTMQKLLMERQNWILMTPEEILGVSASDKMLQPPERDALGKETSLTQLERYLQRERQLRNGPTNSWRNDRAGSPWNFERDPDNGDRPDFGHENTAEAARSFGQLLKGQRNHDETSAPKAKFLLGYVQPAGAGDDTAEPGSTGGDGPVPAVAQPQPRRSIATFVRQPACHAAQTGVDPFFTRPDFIPNPAGASFIPLSSGIARPMGLTPLPDAVSSLLPAVASPARKLQPPPWLLQGPQPFVISQPKGILSGINAQR